MSLETAAGPSVEHIHDIITMSSEQLRDEVNGMLHATTELEAKQHELGFEEISKLFLDVHTDRIDALELAKRDMILETLLDNPDEAFRGEFLQLKLLFEGRSITNERYDGTVINEFCTQNHTKNTCDYLFQHKVLPSGADIYEVSRVFMTFGEPRLIRMALRDNELHVVCQERVRGQTIYVELQDDNRERVMLEFFFDTIHASATQFDRIADEREENDARAKEYLCKVRDNDYLQL